MVKSRFIKENPFHAVERMPEEKKIKQPFDRDHTEIYVSYLKENDYDFYITSLYTYYCALRPNEIVQLKVRNIDLERHLIVVPSNVAKNRNERHILIADEFYKELAPYIERYPGDYLICARGFKPGSRKIYSTKIAEHFRKIADRIGLPKDVFFYSLKDTCAERMIEAGYSAKDIRDLFGHSSIAITDNYLRRRDAYKNEKLQKNFPSL